MKVRNLLLGSLAVAGLATTGAYAADLGVLTSLDVCDNLGLSGLTISSDTNCLQITGEVKYKFVWGDYDEDAISITTMQDTKTFFAGDDANDWDSRFDAWVKFVATSESDFGPAKAVLKLKQVSQNIIEDEYTGTIVNDGSSTDGVVLDEAYVSIGDSTVIMAGKKGSIMNKGDDEPLNWLGLFNSEQVDAGVSWGPDVSLPDGGHVIQVTSDLGNGLSTSVGLEGLNEMNGDGQSGTAVGVLAYKGDGLSAHATFAAGGVLDGEIEDWGVHAGFAGTFDTFQVVLAGAYGSDDSAGDYWNILASAAATFDMFTLAGSFEAADDGFNTDYGVGASAKFAVSDGVTLNLGGRYYYEDFTGDDNYQLAASVSADVTETITLTGEVGYVDDSVTDLFYGSAKLDWAPGGGYTSSVKGTITSEDGYKIESEFKKTFE